MKYAIKSYLSFLPRAYILWAIIILPILMMGAGALSAMFLPYPISFVVVGSLLLSINLISDIWCLGGICSKDCERLDFLKSSLMGLRVMSSVVMVDMLRRFIWDTVILSSVIITMVAIGGAHLGGLQILFLVTSLLIEYVVSVLVSNLLRKVDNVQVLMSYVSIITAIVIFIQVLLLVFFANPEMEMTYVVYPVFAVFAVLLVPSVFLTRANMMRHYKLSYTDRD